MLVRVLLFLVLGIAPMKHALAGSDSLNVHTDFIYPEGKELHQDIYFTAPASFSAALKLACYRFSANGDSILVYQKEENKITVKKGVSKIVISFPDSKGKSFILPSFYRILRRHSVVPPGRYKLFVGVHSDTIAVTQLFIREIDSLLPVNAALRQEIIRSLRPPVRGSPLIRTILKNGGSAATDNVAHLFALSGPRLDRLCKKSGLSRRQYQAGGKAIIDFYDGDWFVGRFELQQQASFSGQLAAEQNKLEDNVGGFAHNQLSNYQSLVSQFRELNQQSKAHNEITGTLSLSGNFSNDQESFSEQDNQFYEARGAIEFPLFDIPISVDGYYTTQDRHRQAKASYVHFRYDAEKAKEQLLKLIGSYNKRYQQTLAQGGNYQMIYGQFLQQLQSQKEKAIGALKQEAGLTDFDPASFNEAALQQKMTELADAEKAKLEDSLAHPADSSSAAGKISNAAAQVEKARASASEKYEQALEKYRQIMELEAKIEKYRQLLTQYENTIKYDSLLAFDQLKDIQNADALSYKDLAKKAAGFLPDNKVKGFITGLTHFDAGMFPQYLSGYTMSGQMLKGLDMGYDIGLATVGASYGKTEYIDGYGNVEAYKAYSGSIQLKPLLNQNVGLVYFGYAPSRSLLTDRDFFKSTDISIPSFRNPVHILSLTYSGALSKYLHVNGEYAFSNQQGQSPEAAGTVNFRDRSAYQASLTAQIPATSINLEAAYEHAGANFENNTLPVILSGTERIMLSGKGDFFRSFLTLGVEYNYLLQNSFYSRGNNVRWGFDLATHSKRYPSVYLSYKPFSTFRSFNDTLSIAQKPILGSVWTGRLNYQIKKQDRVFRFMLLYNKNNSGMDSVQYGSSLIQGGFIYSKGTMMVSLNGGVSQIQSSSMELAYPDYNNSQFISVSTGFNLTDNLNLTGGLDLARCRLGLSRYGGMLGSNYSFRKIPFMLSANFRYSNCKLGLLPGWTPVYSGNITLTWRFHLKLSE